MGRRTYVPPALCYFFCSLVDNWGSDMEATQTEPRPRSYLSLAPQPLSLCRTLQVFTHGVCVGELRDERGVWSFRYDVKWVSTAGCSALTPAIPLQKTPIVDSGMTRPVRRYFEGLLPDERALAALAELAQIDRADSFSLLAYCGAQSAGYHLGDYPRYFCFAPARRKPNGMLNIVSGQRGREAP